MISRNEQVLDMYGFTGISDGFRMYQVLIVLDIDGKCSSRSDSDRLFNDWH